MHALTSPTYGICCDCEFEMPLDRLKGDPAVVFCSVCIAKRVAGYTAKT